MRQWKGEVRPRLPCGHQTSAGTCHPHQPSPVLPTVSPPLLSLSALPPHLGALLLLQQGGLGGQVLLGLLQLGGGGGQPRRQAIALLTHSSQVGAQLRRAPLRGCQLLALRDGGPGEKKGGLEQSGGGVTGQRAGGCWGS